MEQLELRMGTDLATAIPSEIGFNFDELKQLAGAGLGGCVLILVENDKAESVLKRLNEEFYDRLNLPHSAFICKPSEGSKVIY